jgi:catechol 2,3-dioxygenase-like lactoylglutathione lyase family enzyme
VFDHVTIRASDPAAAQRFYELVLATIELPWAEDQRFPAWGNYEFFVLGHGPVTRRLHIAFGAPSREHVDEFWRVGTGAGYRDDGAPGLRPHYREDYYGAFLIDPDGNSVEAVVHGGMRRDGYIDHMWLRVADVHASTRFYETIAPHAALFVRRVDGERTQLIGESGSFSVVRGEPTENVHIAFPATDNTVVDEFHRDALAAGYRDNGAPGERPYHPGYYGAFVFDPDGNNIEVVNHNRD